MLVGSLAALVVAGALPARAVTVSPYFAGYGTIDSHTPIFDWSFNAGFEWQPGIQRVDIAADQGMITDGGEESGLVGNWNFDIDVYAPLWNRIDLSHGGVVTYGKPAPNVFAVTWVNVANAADPSQRNTFQVLVIGTSGYHTNTGYAIQPGSVVFSYGAPGDPAGTVNLSASTPAAIGVYTYLGQLTTLQSSGVGDANGTVTPADLAALRASGDPFLFQPSSTGQGYDPAPISFTALEERIPEPATLGLLVVAGALLGALRSPRRRV